MPEAPPLSEGDLLRSQSAPAALELDRGGGRGLTPPLLIPQTPGMPNHVVPTRYLVGCGMDMKEASERWKLTWEWRAEKGIDNLLDNPPTRMDDFKRLWTHHFHRRAKNNFLDSGQPGKTVWYDVVHPAAFFELSKSMSQADMERYYFYIFEFAYSHLEPADPGGRLVNVYDLSNLTFSALMGKGTDFAKKMMKACNLHYPERADKVFILNAPRFFTYLWKIISVFVDARTQAKINISSTNSMASMLEYIGPENVPKRYGGTDECDLGDAPEEKAFQDFVRNEIRRIKAEEATATAAAAAAVVEGKDSEGVASGTSEKVGHCGGVSVAHAAAVTTSLSSRAERPAPVILVGMVAVVISLYCSGRLSCLASFVLPPVKHFMAVDAKWVPPFHPWYSGFWMGIYLGSALYFVSKTRNT